MINFDDITNENIKEHNPNWPQSLDHPYRIIIIIIIIIIGDSESEKKNYSIS